VSLDRDIQSKIAVLHPETLTVGQTGATVYSADIIDTLGFRNILISPTPSRAYGIADDVRLAIEDSPDGINWTVVGAWKELPTRNVDLNNHEQLFNALMPYYQTFGCTSVQRYLRIGVNNVAGAFGGGTIGWTVIMESELADFVAYDPTNTGDNLP
jgi:hypothetical protein